MVKIAPSILSADMSKLGQEIKDMTAAGADYIHLDVMDGHFVPNITFGPWVVETAKKVTDLPLDVHLMISDPMTYGPIFAKAGADLVSFHVEACAHIHRGLSYVKEAGAKTGLVLNPSTPIETIGEVLAYVDLVLIMSVNPGFGGQSFIPEAVDKVARLRKFLDARAPHHVLIEVDGGVSKQNAQALAQAGADILVAGSYLFKAQDYTCAIESLR